MQATQQEELANERRVSAQIVAAITHDLLLELREGIVALRDELARGTWG